VTAQGFCDGSVVTYCETEADEVLTYDCAELAGTQCGEVNADYGVDCIANPGGTCGFDDGDGFYWGAFCSGTEPACVEKPGPVAVCEENAGTCTDSDVGQCTGDGRVILACAQAISYRIDCVSLGGSCVTDQGCATLPAGAMCDDDVYQCDTGLDCAVGVCVASGVDAGPTDAGAADAGPTDAGAVDSGT